MKSEKHKSKKLSEVNESSSTRSHNDLLLDILAKRKGLVKVKDREYKDMNGNRFMKTPLGFIRKEEQIQKVGKYISDSLTAKSISQTKDNEIDQLKQKVRELKTKTVQLKESHEKKISLENKILRLEHLNNNLKAQIDNLKRLKKFLLEKVERLEKDK